MSSNAELHLTYQIVNAPFNAFPYPHLYIRDAFPADYYARMQSMLPDPSRLVNLSDLGRMAPGQYKERFVMALGGGDKLPALTDEQRAFWSELHGWLVGGAFRQRMIEHFRGLLAQRFKGQMVAFFDEALLVQDTTNYSLGPHSDAPRKVITFLFYLPKDESQSHLGTSLYVPKDRNFRCQGGPHYPHAQFDRVWTMPFLPNSLFIFLKTDTSFHGVEPVQDPDTRRWLLLYDIFHQLAPANPQ
jgi:hypothetical protein